MVIVISMNLITWEILFGVMAETFEWREGNVGKDGGACSGNGNIFPLLYSGKGRQAGTQYLNRRQQPPQ
jgi:hypothetical protein